MENSELTMGKLELILILLLVIVVLTAFYLISMYNNLIRMDQRIQQAFADIDVQVKLRHDLVPNLTETVKGYAKHEHGALEDVIKARGGAVSSGQSPLDQMKSENILTAALGRLLAISEAYPDLKADARFRQLQDELGDIENKIAAARRFYNSAVSEFNAFLDVFPVNMFSRSFGFQSKPFYDLGSQRHELNIAPKIDFKA